MSHTVILIYRHVVLGTLSDNEMTVGVSTSPFNDTITCNLADPEARCYGINPRGEVIMAPQPETEAPDTPHTDEEETKKEQIFASYLERRVL